MLSNERSADGAAGQRVECAVEHVECALERVECALGRSRPLKAPACLCMFVYVCLSHSRGRVDHIRCELICFVA